MIIHLDPVTVKCKAMDDTLTYIYFNSCQNVTHKTKPPNKCYGLLPSDCKDDRQQSTGPFPVSIFSRLVIGEAGLAV